MIIRFILYAVTWLAFIIASFFPNHVNERQMIVLGFIGLYFAMVYYIKGLKK